MTVPSAPTNSAPSSPSSKFPRPTWTSIGLQAALWLGALLWFYSQTLARSLAVTDGVDFGKHWLAARAMLQGASPYEGDLFLSFNYPLLVGFLYMPLGWFSQARAEFLFDIFNALWVLLAALAPGLLLRPQAEPPQGGRPPGGPSPDQVRERLRYDGQWARHLLALFWGPTILFLFGSSQSLQRLIWSGNVDGLNILALSMFAVCAVRRWDGWAGLALASMILIKVAPVLFFLPLVALRRWRTMAVAAGSLGIYALCLILTGWAAVELTLYTRVLPAIPYFWKHISIGFHTSLVGWTVGWESLTEVQYRRFILLLNGTMLLAFAALCTWRWQRLLSQPERLLLISYQAFLVFSPLLELIHVAWILPALVIGLREWVLGRWRPLPFIPWLILWLLLLKLDIVSHTLPLLVGQTRISPHTVMTLFVAASLASALSLGLSSPPTPAPTPAGPQGSDL